MNLSGLSWDTGVCRDRIIEKQIKKIAFNEMETGFAMSPGFRVWG